MGVCRLLQVLQVVTNRATHHIFSQIFDQLSRGNYGIAFKSNQPLYSKMTQKKMLSHFPDQISRFQTTKMQMQVLLSFLYTPLPLQSFHSIFH